jgi:uncharacterized protein YndB with AHSA1/START domain
MTETVSAREIVITRIFGAPREAVWRAWTEPAELAQWWGARGWTTSPAAVALDVRPGGAFRVTSVSDEDGTEMTSAGVYREVVEPEVLVLEEPAEEGWHEGAVSVLTLAELDGGRTEMTLRSTIHTTEEMRGHAAAGLATAIDRLAEALEAR